MHNTYPITSGQCRSLSRKATLTNDVCMVHHTYVSKDTVDDLLHIKTSLAYCGEENYHNLSFEQSLIYGNSHASVDTKSSKYQCIIPFKLKGQKYRVRFALEKPEEDHHIEMEENNVV